MAESHRLWRKIKFAEAQEAFIPQNLQKLHNVDKYGIVGKGLAPAGMKKSALKKNKLLSKLAGMDVFDSSDDDVEIKWLVDRPEAWRSETIEFGPATDTGKVLPLESEDFDNRLLFETVKFGQKKRARERRAEAAGGGDPFGGAFEGGHRGSPRRSPPSDGSPEDELGGVGPGKAAEEQEAVAAAGIMLGEGGEEQLVPLFDGAVFVEGEHAMDNAAPGTADASAAGAPPADGVPAATEGPAAAPGADASYDEHAEEAYDEHAEEAYDEHGEEAYDEHAEEGWDEHGEEAWDEHAEEAYNEHAEEAYNGEEAEEDVHGLNAAADAAKKSEADLAAATALAEKKKPKTEENPFDNPVVMELDKAKHDIDNLEAELKHEQDKRAAIEAELGETKAQLLDKDEKAKKKKEKAHILQDQLLNADAMMSSKKRELAEAQAEKDRLQKNLDDALKQKAKVMEKYEEAEAHWNAEKMKEAMVQHRLNVSEQNLASKKKELADTIAEYNERIRQKETEEEKLRGDLAAEEEAKRSAEKEVEEKQKLVAAKTKVLEAQRAADRAETELAAASEAKMKWSLKEDHLRALKEECRLDAEKVRELRIEARILAEVDLERKDREEVERQVRQEAAKEAEVPSARLSLAQNIRRELGPGVVGSGGRGLTILVPPKTKHKPILSKRKPEKTLSCCVLCGGCRACTVLFGYDSTSSTSVLSGVLSWTGSRVMIW